MLVWVTTKRFQTLSPIIDVLSIRFLGELLIEFLDFREYVLINENINVMAGSIITF